MFCAGCGSILGRDDGVCPNCGRQAGPLIPSLSAAGTEEAGFTRTVRRLAEFYLFFAALNTALAVIGIVGSPWGYATGPWEPWPHPPLMAWTYTGAAAWTLLAARVAVSLVAWDGLKRRAGWGRQAGITAGVLAVTQFPMGLVLGAWTLVKLMGRRNALLYAAVRESRPQHAMR